MSFTPAMAICIRSCCTTSANPARSAAQSTQAAKSSGPASRWAAALPASTESASKNRRNVADVFARRYSRNDRAASRVRSIGSIESRQGDPAARRMRRGRHAATPGTDLGGRRVPSHLQTWQTGSKAMVGSDQVRAPSSSKPAPRIRSSSPPASRKFANSSACAKQIGSRSRPSARARSSRNRPYARLARHIAQTDVRRIVAHEPDDMTVVAEAGITVGELNAAMAAGAPAASRRSMRSRTDHSRIVDWRLASALRLSEGTSRDLLIGFDSSVMAADKFTAEADVVKNVAGYDLMKVMGGSFGTLGIITEADVQSASDTSGETVSPHADTIALA